MPFEIKTLEHVGIDARQVIVSCRHGETVRVFPASRVRFLARATDLVKLTAREHVEAFGCTCAKQLEDTGLFRSRGVR